MTSILCFAPTKNKLGRVDATGAFQPESSKFARVHGDAGHVVRRVLFDNARSPKDVYLDLREELVKESGLACVAMFAHGLKLSIPQAGWTIANARGVADDLARALRPDGVVALYACDAGRDSDGRQDDDTQPGPGGDGGFADALADSLLARGWGGWVDAHTTAGHTTRNPWVRRFRGADAGGTWIVEPGSRLWRAWRSALASRATTLRLRFPLLTEEEIERELSEIPPR